MSKLWSAPEIAGLIGICEKTLLTWEERHFIPTATRQGLRKKRVWNDWKLERILNFARDQGYQIPYKVIEEVNSEQTSQRETASRLSPN